MIARKPIYSTTITTGAARREGRQPSHDGEYVTLYWDADRDWILEDNGGLVNTSCGDSDLEALAEQAIIDYYSPETIEDMLEEGRYLNAEIAQAIREPGELATTCGDAAGDTMIDWGWCVDDEDEDRHNIEYQEAPTNA